MGHQEGEPLLKYCTIHIENTRYVTGVCMDVCQLIACKFIQKTEPAMPWRKIVKSICESTVSPETNCFEHVAQSLSLYCNGLSVRCMQSVNERYRLSLSF